MFSCIRARASPAHAPAVAVVVSPCSPRLLTTVVLNDGHRLAECRPDGARCVCRGISSITQRLVTGMCRPQAWPLGQPIFIAIAGFVVPKNLARPVRRLLALVRWRCGRWATSMPACGRAFGLMKIIIFEVTQLCSILLRLAPPLIQTPLPRLKVEILAQRRTTSRPPPHLRLRPPRKTGTSSRASNPRATTRRLAVQETQRDAEEGQTAEETTVMPAVGNHRPRRCRGPLSYARSRLLLPRHRLLPYLGSSTLLAPLTS